MIPDSHPLFPKREEFVTKHEGTLTFLNGRVYRGDLVPIKGEFNGILEVSGRGFYPVKFNFDYDSFWGLSNAEFDEITDPKLVNTLKYGYRPKFKIYQDTKPFDKEELSRIFSFRDYCIGAVYSGVPDVHVMIQHWIGNYDGGNIGYMPEGKGKITYKNGDVYEGEFKKGKPEGKGKLTFGRYGKMWGDFKDGMLNGEGVSYYPNWGEYRGNFKNGKPDGKRKVTYTNGEIHKGIRENGKFIG